MKGSRQGREAGAALLLAMLILGLVTTVSAGMVWQQTRAVQIEAAERARTQAGWILVAALDWARILLREDYRAAQQNGALVTKRIDTWSTPLEEVNLSTFLAADKDNNMDASLAAFISGRIVDAQARFNLLGVIDGAGKVVPLQAAALQRLADLAGAPSDTAAQLVEALRLSLVPQADSDSRGPLLRPETTADLAWLGVSPVVLERLAPYVALLPVATPVNVNTASREVLVAAIDGLDLGSAERLVRHDTFRTTAEVEAQLPQGVKVDATRLSVFSNWFEVSGRLRLEDRVLEERSLVQRENDKVTVRRRERHSFTTAPN